MAFFGVICQSKINTGKLAYNTGMYEVTISAPICQHYLLQNVMDALSPTVNAVDGVSSSVSDNNRSYYCVGCSDTYRFQLQRQIKDVVAQTVSVGYKNNYFSDALLDEKDDFFKNTLVNTLCIFDSEVDKQFVSKLVDTTKPICIDGYYNFKLSPLKNKWKEVLRLINENQDILHDDDLLLDFLRFLLDGVSCKVKSLSVVFENDSLCLFDDNNRVLDNISSLSPNATAYEVAAVNCICYKPKKLFVVSQNTPIDSFCKFAQRLFDVEYVKLV